MQKSGRSMQVSLVLLHDSSVCNAVSIEVLFFTVLTLDSSQENITKSCIVGRSKLDTEKMLTLVSNIVL